ncbi:MAG: hypothetical protein M0R03_18620 [Novosphingobium sp.]|nr:hypothetical protein [Novosphingobium sp.]
MTTKIKLNKEQEKLVNVLECADFNVHTYEIGGEICAELETYTDGGVNMLITLEPFSVEELKNNVENFSIDEEIETNRLNADYRNMFTITNSVEDFTSFSEKLNRILESLYADNSIERTIKEYKIRNKYVFEGAFYVNAESLEQAREIVDKNCSLLLGGNINTTQSDSVVSDWEFDIKLKTIIY